MLIECTVGRERRVELWGSTYAFLPDQLGRYVADVQNQRHAERFIELPQYRAVNDDAPAQVSQVQDAGGQTLTPQGDSEDGDSQGDGSEGSGSEGGDTEGGESGEREPTIDEARADLEEMSDEALAEEHKEVVGKAPHHKAKRETIIDAILKAEGYAE